MDKIILSHSTKNVFNTLFSLGNYELKPYFFSIEDIYEKEEEDVWNPTICPERIVKIGTGLSLPDLIVYEDSYKYMITDGKRGIVDRGDWFSPGVYKTKGKMRHGFFCLKRKNEFQFYGSYIDDQKIGYWIEDREDFDITEKALRDEQREKKESLKISFYFPKR